MYEDDISIFDTRSNTIEKVGTNPYELCCYMNQAAMSCDGQVVALVEVYSHVKAVSFTKGDPTAL